MAYILYTIFIIFLKFNIVLRRFYTAERVRLSFLFLFKARMILVCQLNRKENSLRSSFKKPDNAHDILPANRTLGHLLAAIYAAGEMTAFENHTLDRRVPTNFAETLVVRTLHFGF